MTISASIANAFERIAFSHLRALHQQTPFAPTCPNSPAVQTCCYQGNHGRQSELKHHLLPTRPQPDGALRVLEHAARRHSWTKAAHVKRRGILNRPLPHHDTPHPLGWMSLSVGRLRSRERERCVSPPPWGNEGVGVDGDNYFLQFSGLAPRFPSGADLPTPARDLHLASSVLKYS